MSRISLVAPAVLFSLGLCAILIAPGQENVAHAGDCNCFVEFCDDCTYTAGSGAAPEKCTEVSFISHCRNETFGTNECDCLDDPPVYVDGFGLNKCGIKLTFETSDTTCTGTPVSSGSCHFCISTDDGDPCAPF